MKNDSTKNPEAGGRHIPFTIDKNHHTSPPVPNPTTGATLRGLPPAISEDYDLWLRARGREDDEIIENDTPVELEPGMHFYTAKREITPGAGE